MEFFCRRYGDLFRIFFYGCIFFYVDIRHFRVSMELCSRESLLLNIARMFDFFSQFFRSLIFSFSFEFSDFDTRNLNEYIDTVKYGSREACSISLYTIWWTDTFFFRVTHIATRTRIHCTNKGKSWWISTGHIDTIDGYFAIFQWLAKCFENMLIEFEKFIEKKYSFMSKRDFSWSWISTTTNDGGFACSMVNNPKWTFGYEWHFSREKSSHRIYLRQLNLFLVIHRWKDSRKCLGEHCFSWSRRSLHENIMSTSSGNKECSFCLFLSMDRRKIDNHLCSRSGADIQFWAWNDGLFSRQYFDSFAKCRNSYDIDIRNDGSLFDIGNGEKYALHSHFSCEYRCWKSSLNTSDISIECKFSKKERSLYECFIELTFFPENSKGNGKIIGGSLFFDVCGSKIDRNTTTARKTISRIFYGTPNSLSTFLDSSISKSHNHELPYARHYINFYFDEISVDSINGCRKELLHNRNNEKYTIILVMIFEKTKVFHIFSCCKVKICPNIWWCSSFLVLYKGEIFLQKTETYAFLFNNSRLHLLSLEDWVFFCDEYLKSNSSRERTRLIFLKLFKLFLKLFERSLKYPPCCSYCMVSFEDHSAYLWGHDG